jgi:coenzyme F420 hydrogenase subunit delta
MQNWYADYMIIGCGNPLQTDDGFGPAVVSELKKLSLPDNVMVLDAGLGGPHYLFTLIAQSEAPIRKMIIVDIMDFGGEPGQIAKVPPELLPPGSYTDPHSWGLLEPLQQLKDRVDIVIFGCQPQCIDISQLTHASEEDEYWLTDSVRTAIPKAVHLVLDEIGVDYGTTINPQEAHHRQGPGREETGAAEEA